MYITKLKNNLLRQSFIFGVITLFFCLLTSRNLRASEFKHNNITIKGQIENSVGKLSHYKDLDVVLLKYILNEEGEVTPVGPQDRVNTKTNGNFEFKNVTPDFKAGYQIGTRVDGELYSSTIFFLKVGQSLVETNIIIPDLSTDIDNLETSQISLVIESGLGRVLVTEILLLNNSTRDRIDSRNLSFDKILPKEIKNFRMLRQNNGKTIEHQIEENVLKIKHIFPIGNTQIIYQYDLQAWFGNLEIIREFNQSLEIVSVFTPVDRLKIRSEDLIFSGKKKINKTNFLSWKSKSSDLNQIKFKISNIPSTSLQYAIVTILLLVILFFTVLLFFWKRLLKEKSKRI